MTRTQIANLAIYHIGGQPMTNVDTDTTQHAIACRAWFDTAKNEMLRSHPWNFATKRARLTTTYLSLGASGLSNSSGKILVTYAGHGLATGDRVTISEVQGLTVANSSWFVTVVNSSTFTLDDSVYAAGYTPSTGKFVKVPTYDFLYMFTAPTDMLRLISLENIQDLFSVETGKILAYTDEILIRYIAKVDDTTLWPDDFSNAFSYLLASFIAQSMSGPAGDALNLRKIYEQMIVPMTKIRDSREGREKQKNEAQFSDIVNSRMGGFYR